MLRFATADQFLPRPVSGWVSLLCLFSLAGFVETVFWGQMSAFTPLYLPRLGVAQSDVATWTGPSVALSGALGVPLGRGGRSAIDPLAWRVAADQPRLKSFELR